MRLTMLRRFIGLDIEATYGGEGEAHAHGATIQIGLAIPTMGDPSKGEQPALSYVSDVKPERNYVSQPEAMAVNGFTTERINDAPLASVVDAEASKWLTENSIMYSKRIPVGWNVGAYDMPFIRRDLPQLGSLFHRRSLDLNAVAFMLSMAHPVRSFESLKHSAKLAAQEAIGRDGWHDAGFDALASLYSLQWFIDLAKSDAWIAAIMRERVG